MHTCSCLTFYAWFDLTYWYTSMSLKNWLIFKHTCNSLFEPYFAWNKVDWLFLYIPFVIFYSYGDTQSCNSVQARWFKLWIKFTSSILRSNLINASGSTTCRIAWLRFSGLAYITLNLMSSGVQECVDELFLRQRVYYISRCHWVCLSTAQARSALLLSVDVHRSEFYLNHFDSRVQIPHLKRGCNHIGTYQFF